MPEALIGYMTLFAWSFLAATVLPLGSEPALFALVIRGHPVLSAVIVATIGNYLGACTTFCLGRRGADVLSRRRAVPLADSRAARLLRRFGQPALLLSWVPIVGDAIVVAAGASSMPFLPFSVWVFIGKLARYAAVAWGAVALRS